jgi:DNA mismatch endonuclease, patch repair protein
MINDKRPNTFPHILSPAHWCIKGLHLSGPSDMNRKKNKRKLRTTPQRSALMSKIRAKNTKPEMTVRRALHGLGYRFRLHVRQLPGCPDIVMRRHSTVIQVKGCFWHGHNCLKGRLPKSNRFYWLPKLRLNKVRDSKNEHRLRRMGWRVKTVWECKLKNMKKDELRAKLSAMLS